MTKAQQNILSGLKKEYHAILKLAESDRQEKIQVVASMKLNAEGARLHLQAIEDGHKQNVAAIRTKIFSELNLHGLSDFKGEFK